MIDSPLRCVDVFDHIPLIAVGERRIGGVPEPLPSLFRQPHLLGLLIEAGKICLVVALYGIAPQTVEIPSRLQCEAVVLAAGSALDDTLAAIAVPPHGGEVFQDALAEIVHHLVQLLPEFLGIQLLGTSGPPGVVKAFTSMVSEVDPDVSNGPQLLVSLRCLGIEKPRFLGESGAQQIADRGFGAANAFFGAEL